MAGANAISAESFKSISKQNVVNSQVQLKPGQILSGKVLEIYPNQRAVIQLGGKQFTAELQTPLSLHNNYWFQVQSVGELLRLKVLVDKPLTNKNKMELLLKEMGLPVIKANQSFVQTLLKSNIPFEKEQLKQALQLIANQGSNTVSHQVLIEILKRNLPMTSTVYQAILASNTTNLNEQLLSLSSEIENLDDPSATLKQLFDRITTFINNPKIDSKTGLVKMLLEVSNYGDQKLFTLLNKSGTIPATLTFENWQKSLSDWQQNNSVEIQKDQQLNNAELPVNKNETDFLKDLYQLSNRQLPISSVMKNQFVHLVNQIEANKINHSNSLQIEQLKTFIHQSGMVDKLLSVLANSEQMLLKQWLQDSSLANFEKLLLVLRDVANKQLSGDLEKKLVDLLVKAEEGQMRSNIPIRDKFLTQLKQFLYFSGIDHESGFLNGKIDQNVLPQERSLKYLILQAIQDIGVNNSEKLDQALHLVNGMQLSSIQEDGPMIQVSLQVPGVKLGLNKDMQVDIESRKDSSGQINPDFCRIFFHLDLEKMGETMIDMSIQKRLVNLTIYNHNDSLDHIILNLKPILKMGLQKINYQLSTVQFKNTSLENKRKAPVYSDGKSYSQGVDFRI